MQEDGRRPPPPPPQADGKFTVALLGGEIQWKNRIGNLILNEDYFHSTSNDLVVGGNQSSTVIVTPDFDVDCPYLDQQVIDFMAISHPGLDLFILVLDPENTQEEKVLGQITNLQSFFGEHITEHLAVMVPGGQGRGALDHLEEMFNLLVVNSNHNLPEECRRWCSRGHHFLFEFKHYSQAVVLRRKAELDKKREEPRSLRHGRCVQRRPTDLSAIVLREQLSGRAQAAPCTSVVALQDDMFNIIFLGQSGTGKSSSANTVLAAGRPKDQKPFLSQASSVPVTSSCDVRFMKKLFGVPVRLVDTPDFFHEELQHPESHMAECRRFAQRGRCVLLLVIQLGRFSDGERHILQCLEEGMGWSLREETVLLLTHGDDLKGDLMSHVNSHPHLQSIAQMCAGRVHVFNNKSRDERQVSELIKKIPHYRERFPKFNRKEDVCQVS